MRYVAGLLALGFALTACSGAGGGGTHAVLPSPAHGGQVQTATIKVTIPKASTKAKYISAATQSIAISVYDHTHTTLQTTANQNLTSGSPGCTTPTPISPLTCAISIALTPGSYALDLTTYDGLLSGSTPTGNQLSSNLNFPVTIVAGQANSIPVSLGGIPTSVVLSPGATSVLSGNNASGYSWGSTCPTGAQSVSVFGVDADGNYILGPGAPTVSLYAANTRAISVGAVGASAPNAFNVTCLGVAGNVNLVASAIPAASTGASTPSNTIGTTAAHAIGGTFTQVPINTIYISLAAGPDGNLWAVQSDNNIARVTPAGAITTYPESPNCQAERLVAGPDGALWIAEVCQSGSVWGIGRVTTSGVITHYTDANTSPGVGPIVTGSDGALWFVPNGIVGIGRMTTAGVTSMYSSGITFGVFNMASGPDGAIWFTEFTNVIGRISTSGAVTEYPIPSGGQGTGITAGPDGAVWFCESGNRIGRITTAGVVSEYSSGLSASANPSQITAGADGALWFTESGQNDIGRITTSGVITEFPVSPSGQLQGITMGPDGALWLNEGTSQLGHFQ